MGKTRKLKTYVSKTNPLGYDDSTVFVTSAGEPIDSVEGPIAAIKDQLKSANIEEKINGLQSFSVLTTSRDKAAHICQTDIVRIAGPLLCEKDHCVRNAAAGALRNLSVVGTEVCDYLVEQDILTPLLALLNEYSRDVDWKPTFDVNMCNQMDLYSDVFLQASNLLWNLCESSPLAVETFNHTLLMETFIRCLDFTAYGSEIAISAGQCLLVVSENNPKTWRILNEHLPNFLHIISLTGNYDCLYVRALVAGILANVPTLTASYGNNIVHIVSKVIAIDHKTVIADILNLESLHLKNDVPELDIKMETADDETEEAAANRRRRQELPTQIDVAITNIGYLLDAQRVGAEIITNLLLADDESCEGHDNDGTSENESVVDYVADTVDDSINTTGCNQLPLEFSELIKASGLVDKLWQRAQPLPNNLADVLRDTSFTLLMKVKNLRISSILCLQNLCNCLNAEDLGGHLAIYNVWLELGQQVFQLSKDAALLEPCTSLMRSALVHLKNNRELFNQMTRNDLELILNGVKTCSIAEVRANWLRMLGTLGCLLSEPLIKPIISFIVETCAQEENVWTISEALDALMDMFADNDWLDIVIDLDLAVILSRIQKDFKNKARSQCKHLKKRYPAVQTVRTNLARFIRYIESYSIE